MDLGDYIQGRSKAQANHFLPAVRPLAVPDESGAGLEPAGSSVLLWYRGKRYILSAAHVVELYPDRQYYIGSSTNWQPIDGPFRVPALPVGGREADHFDFAFRAVDDTFAQSLDGCRFLQGNQFTITDATLHETPHRSKYLALGYPLNKFGMDWRAKMTVPRSLAFTGAIAPVELYGSLKLSTDSHILLEYDAEEVVGPRGFQQSPKLTGLSGGAMLRLPSLEEYGSVAPALMAGVIIEHRRPEKLMIGVRLRVVTSAIDRQP